MVIPVIPIAAVLIGGVSAAGVFLYRIPEKAGAWATQDIHVTNPPEGTCRAVVNKPNPETDGKLIKFVMNRDGFCFLKDLKIPTEEKISRGYLLREGTRPKIDDWWIVEYKEHEKSSVSRQDLAFGIYGAALSGVHWMSVFKTVGTRVNEEFWNYISSVKSPDGTVITDEVKRWHHYNRNIPLGILDVAMSGKQVEDLDRIPLDVVITFSIQVVNPYLLLYNALNWYKSLEQWVASELIARIGKNRYEEIPKVDFLAGLIEELEKRAQKIPLKGAVRREKEAISEAEAGSLIDPAKAGYFPADKRTAIEWYFGIRLIAVHLESVTPPAEVEKAKKDRKVNIQRIEGEQANFEAMIPREEARAKLEVQTGVADLARETAQVAVKEKKGEGEGKALSAKARAMGAADPSAILAMETLPQVQAGVNFVSPNLQGMVNMLLPANSGKAKKEDQNPAAAVSGAADKNQKKE